MMTETNAKPIEPTCSMCPSYPRIQAELDRLTAALAEKEAECEKQRKELDRAAIVALDNAVKYSDTVDKLQAAESLAASRLADQEAIERHTTRRVAGECAEIAEAMWSDHYYWAWPAMQTAAEIRKKYGVE